MQSQTKQQIEIADETRTDSIQIDDQLLKDIDPRIKENPYWLSSSDFKDLMSHSWGDNVSSAAIGALMLSIVNFFAKTWSGVEISRWESNVIGLLLVVSSISSFIGKRYSNREKNRVVSEVREHFDRERFSRSQQRQRWIKHD